VAGPGDEQAALLSEARAVYEAKGNLAAAASLPTRTVAPS
jgi:hypothetical protein